MTWFYLKNSWRISVTAVVISQPMYFPWPGFFQLLSLADVYIHLDDVQFSKGSFVNRVQVKHPDGIKWMSVALSGSKGQSQISMLKPHNPHWHIEHRRLITECFADAPFKMEALSLFDQIIGDGSLPAVLRRSINLLAEKLRIFDEVRSFTASEMNVNGRSWRRVLDLVHAVNGTKYITAHGAANYLDHEAFEREGVTVEYVDYRLETWPQLHGPFSPYVTSLDLIANCGSSSKDHVRGRAIPWRHHLKGRET